MKKVEIFKTHIQHPKQAEKICMKLSAAFPGSKINFDLDDCDKILRIESSHINVEAVLSVMKNLRFYCTLIPDN